MVNLLSEIKYLVKFNTGTRMTQITRINTDFFSYKLKL